MTRVRHASAGFTLIEAIMVIVITGILSGIVAVFITKPVQGYVDSVRRAELTDAADVALRRMTRDLRLALPNSLRTSGNCIEYIATSAGGRYRDPADGSTGGDFLSFTDAADTKFHVLGKTSNATTAFDYIAAGDYVVIYNLGSGYTPADAYTGGNRALVSSVTCGGSGTPPCYVTLASNPFAAQSPPLPSPNSRFQVVPGGTQAVSYVCSGGQLQRYANYGFNAAQACPPAGTPATLAGGGTTTAACTIEYTSNATGRNGLLFIGLTLTDTPSSESVTLFQQIHVDNAP
jgi:MSHA biogenesis protein MshO